MSKWPQLGGLSWSDLERAVKVRFSYMKQGNCVRISKIRFGGFLATTILRSWGMRWREWRAPACRKLLTACASCSKSARLSLCGLSGLGAPYKMRESNRVRD